MQAVTGTQAPNANRNNATRATMAPIKALLVGCVGAAEGSRFCSA